ncbi:hypothetical protein VCRA2120E8_110067 [Vibrio crassostreae]|nr:hypothetical protein VCRA2120E8_110067 [Vibrio crassostreae]
MAPVFLRKSLNEADQAKFISSNRSISLFTDLLANYFHYYVGL